MNAKLIAAYPCSGTRLVNADGYADLLQRQAQLFAPLTHAASDERGWLRMLTRHVAILVTMGTLVVTLFVTKISSVTTKTTPPVMSVAQYVCIKIDKKFKYKNKFYVKYILIKKLIFHVIKKFLTEISV